MDTEGLLRSLATMPIVFVEAQDMSGTEWRRVGVRPVTSDPNGQLLRALTALRGEGLACCESVVDGSQRFTTWRPTALGRHRAGIVAAKPSLRNRVERGNCSKCGKRLNDAADDWSVDSGNGTCVGCEEAAARAWARTKYTRRKQTYAEKEKAERRTVAERPRVDRQRDRKLAGNLARWRKSRKPLVTGR